MTFGTRDKYFFVHGSADGPSPLNSFDNALLASGIGNTNLIRISSILPPGAQEISIPALRYGDFLPIAYAQETSDVAGELIAAAVAVGVPGDTDRPGVIMEHHMKGSAKECEDIARQLVRNAFETRGFVTRDIKSVAVEARVTAVATAVAGVVLWA
jgi:arginine decarboxylase